MCLAILIVWPKVSSRIPASPIAVIAGAAMVPALRLNVNSIGGLCTISVGLPTLRAAASLEVLLHAHSCPTEHAAIGYLPVALERF